VTAEFKTADGARWQIDTLNNTWIQVGDAGETLQSGKLITTGLGIHSLEPRTPKFQGAGGGLCSAGFWQIQKGHHLHTLLKVNVDVDDFTVLTPITEISYEIVR